MTDSRKGMWTIIIVAILIIITILLIVAAGGTSSLPSTGSQSSTASGTAQTVVADYTCNGGKTINATYSNATSATTTGNSVQLVLSDGRQMTLRQTMSADGARYSNGDPSVTKGQPGAETFVFWSKGNGAIVEENGTSSNYTNCVASSAL